ncbi:nucleotide exchange factor GrpE [Patescibacteria group bacterium]|nr:nucleotide exchange factor GrpE [Patescibacteria group bacterium]MBU1755048.1 nucleotide exchange factor GrpE [Patescibacteria group bacterium]
MTDDEITIDADGTEEGASEEEIEAQESRVDSKLAKVKKELEQCKKEKQEYLDGWQRSKADYVNVLKRAEEERVAAMEKGKTKAAQAFITVIDTLIRAEQSGDVPDSFKSIAKQLHDAAKNIGLTQFGEVGDMFDPSLHEALGQDVVESSELDDSVTVVLEAGWKSGDTVLRPAKVRVGQMS